MTANDNGGPYKPNGTVQGGNDNIPMKHQSDGEYASAASLHESQRSADLSQSATNSMGGISSSTKSDAPDAESSGDKELDD